MRIVRTGPDRFNISDLLERPREPSGGLRVTVDHFAIKDGWVSLEDRVLSPVRTWRSENIQLDARDITTTARRGTAVGSTTVAGALVTLRVSELQLVPVHLHADVNIRDLDLTLVDLYMPPDSVAEVESGVVLGLGLLRVLEAGQHQTQVIVAVAEFPAIFWVVGKLGQQLLAEGKGGALFRTVKVSTGSGKKYCEKGRCGVAHRRARWC